MVVMGLLDSNKHGLLDGYATILDDTCSVERSRINSSDLQHDIEHDFTCGTPPRHSGLYLLRIEWHGGF